MDVKLLRKVKEHILEDPNRFVMNDWIIRKEAKVAFLSDDESWVPFAPCGTAACIAGWASILGGEKDSYRPWEDGARLLGLSGDIGARDRLFDVYRWPSNFQHQYRSAKSQAERAKIAAERIDHFIATKGKE